MPRRKKTIPIASYAWPSDEPAPVLKLASADWQRLEKVLGCGISPTLRKAVSKATNRYLKLASREYSIEPLSDAQGRLEQLITSARHFWKVLTEVGSSDANFYADSLVEAHFIGPHIARRNQMRILTDIMTTFVGACEAAQRGAIEDKAPGHSPGDYWNAWIVQLIALLEGEGLPTAVRKDGATSRSNEVSPFARFVHELQGQFGAELQRGRHSLTALSEAISKARGSQRPLEDRPNKTRPR